MLNKTAAKLATQEKELANAESYEQWQRAALAHDELSGAARWRQQDPTRLYDYGQIRRRLDKLRQHRVRKDDHALLFTLNEGIHGNMGGMGRAGLYAHALSGTKHLIEDYIEEIVHTLDIPEGTVMSRLSYARKVVLAVASAICRAEFAK